MDAFCLCLNLVNMKDSVNLHSIEAHEISHQLNTLPKQFHTWEGHNRQGVVKPGPRLLLAADRPIREQTLDGGQCLRRWARGGTNGPLVEGGWWVKRVVARFMRRPLKHLSSALVALLYSSEILDAVPQVTSGIISLNCILSCWMG